MISLLDFSIVMLGTVLITIPIDSETKSFTSVPQFPEKYYRFLTSDGKAAVRFPDKPRQSKRTLRSRDGSITLQMATYATAEGDVFLFGYAALPAVPQDPDTVLQGVLEGLIRDHPTIQWKKIGYGDKQLPGREVTWRKDDKHMVCRYILDKQRLYQIMVLGSQQFVTSHSARAFLDSLLIE
jgi:hypothetical protein